jgi:FtsP/CotA-like multicopper oxidase with cupredoxin domain
MVRIGQMASPKLTLNRRELMAGLGTLALAPGWPVAGSAQGRSPLALRMQQESLPLRSGAPATEVWSLAGPPLRLKQGQNEDIEVRNELPSAIFLNWRGVDGAQALEPFLAGAPLASGSNTRLQLTARHAGTFLCELIPFGAGLARPATRMLPVIVAERDPIAVDREEILLIEEWRLRSDASAIAPGMESEKTASVYTLNGKPSFDITAKKHERLRLRFINGTQRTPLAIKLDAVELCVMAIDGQPAEPFLARNGAVVLPPGGRIDAFVDATASSSILLHDGKEAFTIGRLDLSGEPPIRNMPLPPAPPLSSNGLPAQIDLKNALRFDITVPDKNDILGFSSFTPPAFRAKAGRAVVLALVNRAPTATVFHLHGHHFRLLDRLDDGWKPFWLDTLAVEPGQTQRIAFLAEYAGRWLIESVATDWAAPRLVRWYSVA